VTSISVAAPPAPRPLPLLERVRINAPEIVGVTLVLAFVHLFGEISFARDEGTSPWESLGTIVAPGAIALALAVGFHLLRPALQAWTAFVAGSIATADGAIHIDHWAEGGDLTWEDAVGLASGAGGLVLLALAIVISARPKTERRRVSRWAARLGFAAGTFGTVLFVIVPVSVAVYFVHKPALPVPATAIGIEHQTVALQTSDGLMLAGSYAPGHNGAVVILVHGSGGDRSGSIASRARILARNGYGVLAYDARGGGESEGKPEALGWTWYRDVQAAVDFLEEQGIKAKRIGALGLSTGAEVVLETAGRDKRIAAVVAEGAQARTLDELRLLPNSAEKAYLLSNFTVTHSAYRAFRRIDEPPPLDEMIPRISPRPVFLMSAGSGYEADINREYARVARWPSRLWEMPDAMHTGGLKAYPREYESRVVDFFDEALLGLRD
jgi:alpha/beta superfamily hydrolase